MNLGYILPRLVRHFLPETLTRFLLRRGWIIRPGIESSDARAAVDRYREALESQGHALIGRRILVFGYGGRFDIGIELLRQGAGHVILCDRYALPDQRHNRGLLPAASADLQESGGKVMPRPERITLFQGDIRDAARERLFAPVDLVLSSSVFEHLPGAGIDSLCAALAGLTLPGGVHIHFIDLRDHFFKYPFEMLTFSEAAWQRWLNPTSNLNRWRAPDYLGAFEKHFKTARLTLLESDPAAWERVLPRLQPRFLLDDPAWRSATQIRLDAGL